MSQVTAEHNPTLKPHSQVCKHCLQGVLLRNGFGIRNNDVSALVPRPYPKQSASPCLSPGLGLPPEPQGLPDPGPYLSLGLALRSEVLTNEIFGVECPLSQERKREESEEEGRREGGKKGFLGFSQISSCRQLLTPLPRGSPLPKAPSLSTLPSPFPSPDPLFVTHTPCLCHTGTRHSPGPSSLWWTETKRAGCSRKGGQGGRKGRERQ